MIWRVWAPRHVPPGSRAVKMTRSVDWNGIHAELIIRNDDTCRCEIGDGEEIEVTHWKDWRRAKDHAMEVIGLPSWYTPYYRKSSSPL